MSKTTSTYIYNIEVMVEDNHHTAALVQLLQRLNQSGFSDYKINSGIQIGSQIDHIKATAASIQQVPIGAPKSSSPKKSSNFEQKQTASSDVKRSDGFTKLHDLMRSNKLIRLVVNKGLGIKMDIPCRVINIEDIDGLVTVYHVDEKQVYTFRLTEIEDYTEA